MPAIAPLPAGAQLRLLEPGDAPALLAAQRKNRDYLFPFEPDRPDSFWTSAGQEERVASLIAGTAAGTRFATAIVRDGRILGCLTLSDIVRGPLCSASLGYWVDADETGQGLASTAVGAICRVADEQLGLHRIGADTLLTNQVSQRVLARNGFIEYGLAPQYLHIGGRWQDCRMFQRILNDRPPQVG
jgi:[ribosomal protein S5]-alanine N-acetyltransferase